MSETKKFCCYFYFVGWDCISLGGHICTSQPNIEIHLPFGFIRVGWLDCYSSNIPEIQKRTFGWMP